MTPPLLCIKIDVDTDRGTRIGVPNLCRPLRRIRHQGHVPVLPRPRQYRPGHQTHLPSGISQKSQPHQRGLDLRHPDAAERRPAAGSACGAQERRRHARCPSAAMRSGIHCYDHIRWQDGLAHDAGRGRRNSAKRGPNSSASSGTRPGRRVCRLAGERFSLAAYDEAGLLYASDRAGRTPFSPG